MKLEKEIFRVQPKIPENLNIHLIKEIVLKFLEDKKLKKPEIIAITGSYVWNYFDYYSDIDIIVFGDYYLQDFLIDTDIGSIEISTIPIDPKKLDLALPYETRWDIISAVSLDKENEEKLSKIKQENLLKEEEINCMLSHIINRLSWLGILKRTEYFKNEEIFSLFHRYYSNYNLNNFNVLFYCLDLLAIAQYVLNKLPYPFVKNRILHLNKLKICSETLLDFAKNYDKYYIDADLLLSILSKSLEETLELIEKSNYLSNGLENEEECRKKIKPYPYF